MLTNVATFTQSQAFKVKVVECAQNPSYWDANTCKMVRDYGFYHQRLFNALIWLEYHCNTHLTRSVKVIAKVTQFIFKVKWQLVLADFSIKTVLKWWVGQDISLFACLDHNKSVTECNHLFGYGNQGHKVTLFFKVSDNRGFSHYRYVAELPGPKNVFSNIATEDRPISKQVCSLLWFFPVSRSNPGQGWGICEQDSIAMVKPCGPMHSFQVISHLSLHCL